MNDKLIIGGREFNSRFILGSGKYSLDLIDSAVRYAGAEIITLALRRAVGGQVENILDYIPKGVTLLPNTSRASWQSLTRKLILYRKMVFDIPFRNIFIRKIWMTN